jgi:sarcosine oxidase subunit alpha
LDSGGESFEFAYNGRPIPAIRGDTIAVALTRAGFRIFSRSLKFHRPRGLYCGSGRCFSCVMRVDGVPGVRTCSTLAVPGIVVESERGFPTTSHDVLSFFDHVFRKEFDYHSRFMRPAFMTPAYQRILRRLASSSRLADNPDDFKPLERKECDVLVIGHGVSGSVAYARFQSAGTDAIVVDKSTRGHDGTTSTAFGFFEDGEVGVQSGQRLQLITAKSVLLATGRAETSVPMVNGDLPGVMLPESVHSLSMRGVRAGERAAIVGRNELVNRVVRELEASGIETVANIDNPASIVRVLGRSRVSGIETRDENGSRRRIGCDLVIPFGPLVPSIELAQQAGCELRADGGLWHVKVDETGRTTVPGVFACGGVTGLYKGEDRIASGQSAASSIVKFLGGS